MLTFAYRQRSRPSGMYLILIAVRLHFFQVLWSLLGSLTHLFQFMIQN